MNHDSALETVEKYGVSALPSGYEQVYDDGMFEELARQIEELSIPLDGDAMAEAFALADRLQAKLADAVAGFDSAELWDIEGRRR